MVILKNVIDTRTNKFHSEAIIDERSTKYFQQADGSELRKTVDESYKAALEKLVNGVTAQKEKAKLEADENLGEVLKEYGVSLK